MEFLIAGLIGFLVYEIYAWQPRVTAWLVARAVKFVDSEHQDRCREEWQAGIDELPSTIFRIVHAASFFAAAHRLNRDICGERLGRARDKLKNFSHVFSDDVAELRSLASKRHKLVEVQSTVITNLFSLQEHPHVMSSISKDDLDSLFSVLERLEKSNALLDAHFDMMLTGLYDCQRTFDTLDARYQTLVSWGSTGQLLNWRGARHLLDELEALRSDVTEAVSNDKLGSLIARHEEFLLEFEAKYIPLAPVFEQSAVGAGSTA